MWWRGAVPPNAFASRNVLSRTAWQQTVPPNHSSHTLRMSCPLSQRLQRPPGTAHYLPCKPPSSCHPPPTHHTAVHLGRRPEVVLANLEQVVHPAAAAAAAGTGVAADSNHARLTPAVVCPVWGALCICWHHLHRTSTPHHTTPHHPRRQASNQHPPASP